MKISAVVWKPEIIDKLESKHGVTAEEVEQVFELGAVFRRGARGHRRGENLYLAFGQTAAGRYLFIAFVHKLDRRALILSARDMTSEERQWYRKD